MNKDKIVNCTPHDIMLLVGPAEDGRQVTLPKSGILPRVATIETEGDEIGGFPAVMQMFGEVEGLPEPIPGTYYLVSGMVFGATPRKDIVAPDTGKTAQRNAAGHIVAVTRLLRK